MIPTDYRNIYGKKFAIIHQTISIARQIERCIIDARTRQLISSSYQLITSALLNAYINRGFFPSLHTGPLIHVPHPLDIYASVQVGWGSAAATLVADHNAGQAAFGTGLVRQASLRHVPSLCTIRPSKCYSTLLTGSMCCRLQYIVWTWLLVFSSSRVQGMFCYPLHNALHSLHTVTRPVVIMTEYLLRNYGTGPAINTLLSSSQFHL